MIPDTKFPSRTWLQRLFFAFGSALCLAQPSHAQIAPVQGWSSSVQLGSIVHFCVSSPSTIVSRYDMATEAWLPNLSFPGRQAATAMAVDADGIYIAFSQSCYAYDLTGGAERHLLNAASEVHSIHTDGDVLIINHSNYINAKLVSISKTSNTVIDTFDNYIDTLVGASHAPGINKIFGRTQGVSPADITYASYGDDGYFLTGGDSPHHGDFAGAERTWTFPDGQQVTDNAGIVYSTTDLQQTLSFGGTIEGIAFRGTDVPVVLRGQKLIAHTNTLLPAGSADLSVPASAIFIEGEDVFAFRRDAAASSGIAVESVPLARLTAPEPGAPKDPRGLAFTANSTWVDARGDLMLFSKAHQSVFRWMPSTQGFGTTIPLIGSPDYAAYSLALDSIFLAYSDGLIRRINLAEPAPVESPFAILPAMPLGLATMGTYIMTADNSGAWNTHRTFGSDGVQISAEDWNYYSDEFVWSPSHGRLYFFRDDSSPNDLLYEEVMADGSLGTKMDSPYHGDHPIAHPIRVEQGGFRVATGSGIVYNASDLTKTAYAIGNSFIDGLWEGGNFLSLRDIAGVAQLQEWTGPTLAPARAKQWPGKARSVKKMAENQFVIITELPSGIPSFHLMDAAWQTAAPSQLEQPQITGPQALSLTSVTLQWTDVTGERGYRVERRLESEAAWTFLGATNENQTTFFDSSVTQGLAYAYRVTAFHGTLFSVPSEEFVCLFAPPASPGSFTATGNASLLALNWARVSSAVSYRVQVRHSSGAAWQYLVETAGLSHTLSRLPYTDYYFRVVALSGLGESLPVESSVLYDRPAPETPIFTNPLISANYIKLNWNESAFATDYVLEVRLSGSTQWTPLATTSENYFVHTSLAAGVTYDYRIKAENPVGASAFETKTYTTLTKANPIKPNVLVYSDTRKDAGTLRFFNPNYPLISAKQSFIYTQWRLYSVATGASAWISTRTEGRQKFYSLEWETPGDFASVITEPYPMTSLVPYTAAATPAGRKMPNNVALHLETEDSEYASQHLLMAGKMEHIHLAKLNSYTDLAPLKLSGTGSSMLTIQHEDEDLIGGWVISYFSAVVTASSVFSVAHTERCAHAGPSYSSPHEPGTLAYAAHVMSMYLEKAGYRLELE